MSARRAVSSHRHNNQLTGRRSAIARRSGRLALGLVVVVMAALMTACGDGADSSAATPTTAASVDTLVDLSNVEWVDRTSESEVVIQSRDNTFLPGHVIVKVGTPITFRNVGRTEHNALPVDEISFIGIEAKDFNPKDEHTISFDKPGDYPYYCSLHGSPTKGMIGAIRVVK